MATTASGHESQWRFNSWAARRAAMWRPVAVAGGLCAVQLIGIGYAVFETELGWLAFLGNPWLMGFLGGFNILAALVTYQEARATQKRYGSNVGL